jgi:pilus assembly protein CpaB
MNLKTWVPLGLAIVLGLFAAKFALDMIAKKRSGDTGGGKLVQVVVAKQPIGAGEALTGENCKLGSVDAGNVPDGSFRSISELEGNKRVAQVQLGNGQPVTENLLAPIGTGVGLQAVIPPGKRAISIEINEFSGVGGMLIPGCHVDVLATVPGENGGEMISRTIVQAIQVSAVGQRMINQPVAANNSDEKKNEGPQVVRSVTLLATPAEAEAIELASTSGRPRLVLRSGADKQITQTGGVTASNLRGISTVKPVTPPPVVSIAPPPAVPKTQTGYWVVKVIRGGQESEVRFEANGTRGGMTQTDSAPATGGR